MENRIFGMTALIQYSEFDIFDRESKPDWDRIVFVFMRDVSTFEDELKDYLGSLFKESLSWENAYILARSFDEEDVSPSIKEFIDNSRTDMLRQFANEISITENKFLAQENNPPLLEGIPAATSSILWAKNLLLDISRPLAKIFENDTMSKKDLEVQERFKKTEQLLLSYKNAKYDSWKVEAAEKLNQFLQTSVLKKRSISTEHLIGITKLEASVSYVVNFPIYLEEVGIEARILEHLGYEIPSFVANVVLQEKTFIRQRNELTIILKELHNSLSSLQKEEISVLEIPIENLCSFLDLGTNGIQWETTRLPEFLKKSKQAVDVFKGIISQTKNIFLAIDKKIDLLSGFELLEWPEVKTFGTICEDFFGDAGVHIERKISTMVRIYRSLGPLLVKLESITCKTSTGEAAQMRDYYRACESRVLKALIQMMLSNLEYFHVEVMDHIIIPYAETAFKSADELIASSTDQIKLVFVRFLKNALESTRRLIRWLDGTCKESSPFHSEDKKLRAEFSYYLDLSLHPQIKDLSLNIISKFFVCVRDMK